jgi:hypothetical protein
MPGIRRWVGRRRATESEVESPGDQPADVPPPPALDDSIPPPPALPHIEPGAPQPEGAAADETDRSPLAQGRYDRLAAAAGIDPDRDLSPHGRSVLDWLSRQDDAVCSGIVELLQATSLATARHLENAGH